MDGLKPTPDSSIDLADILPGFPKPRPTKKRVFGQLLRSFSSKLSKYPVKNEMYGLPRMKVF
jgi:hypothetical protein